MPKTIDYYLSKGFDKNMAEYFASGRKKITDVKPQKDYTLIILFSNQEKRRFDMKPLLKKNTVFEPFLDIKRFMKVYIDDTNSICWDIDSNVDSEKVWTNKVDLSSDTCYVQSVPI